MRMSMTRREYFPSVDIILTLLFCFLWILSIECQADVETNNSSQTQPPVNETIRPIGYHAFMYENLRLYFLRWYLPVVISMGALGTVFCLIFLFLSRLFPTNMLIWLVSICVGDFLILVNEGVWMFLKVWFGYDFRDVNDVICVVHTAFSNYLLYWSAYMQSFLSLQRAFLIIRPLRARHSGPSGRVVLLQWAIISLLLILPVLPYILYWRVVKGDCDPVDRRLYYITTVCDFIVWGMIPLIAMTTATVVICWNVFQFGRRFKASQANPPAVHQLLRLTSGNFRGSENSLEQRPMNVNGLLIRHNHLPNCLARLRPLSSFTSSSQNSTSTDRINYSCPNTSMFNLAGGLSCSEVHPQIALPAQTFAGQRHGAADNTGHVARLLIGMNVWYVISTFPLLTYLMVLNFILPGIDPHLHRFMYYLNRSLCFLNACSNWIFYCASGRLFRQKISQIFYRIMKRIRIPSNHRQNTNVPVIRITPTYDWTFKTSQLKKQSSSNTQFTSTKIPKISRQAFRQGGISNVEESGPEVSQSQILFKLLRYYFQCFCYCPSTSIARQEFQSDSATMEIDCHPPNMTSKGRQGEATSLRTQTLCDCNACFSRLCCLKVWCVGNLITGWTTKSVDQPSLSGFLSKSNSSTSMSAYFHSTLLRSQLQLMQVGSRSTETFSDPTPAGRHQSAKKSRRRYKTYRLQRTGLESKRGYSSAPASLGEPNSVSLVNTSFCDDLPTTGGSRNDRMSRISESDHRSTCYCYISSQGGRRYQYHFCKIHRHSGLRKQYSLAVDSHVWPCRDPASYSEGNFSAGQLSSVHFAEQSDRRQCHCCRIQEVAWQRESMQDNG